MLNVAVAGLGWWGKTILRTLRGNAKLRIVMAVDPEPAAEATAREEGVAFARDLDAALANADVAAVILCTPHTLHAEQILRAAAAGKHVFCEKPLCLTRADAARAIQACREAGVALGIGHERRFEPPILELRRLVESGELGTLLQIEANFSQDKFLALPPDNWRLSAKEAPAGPMTATGIHLLDLSVSFLGQPERVLASVRQLGSNLVNGDTLAALVQFRSGAHAMISAILATPFDGRFAIYGSQGWAEVRDLAHPEAPEGWRLTKTLRGARPVTTEYPPAAPVRANLEAFADAAAGRAPYPVPPEEMLANIAAFEAIVRSAGSWKLEAVES
jgi:predicted dehydrogenase